MNGPTRVVVLGAGGHGRVVGDAVMSRPDMELGGFLDARVPPGQEPLPGIPVLGRDDLLGQLAARGVTHAVVGVGSVGDATIRARLYRSVLAAGLSAATVVHAAAVVARDVHLGAGTVALARVVVNTGTGIGINCILNTGCIVEHNCVVGDHVHIAPGAVLGGDCRIGDGSHIGIGATLIQGISVGRNTLVAAGAVVTRDLGDNMLAAGCPARVIKPRPEVAL